MPRIALPAGPAVIAGTPLNFRVLLPLLLSVQILLLFYFQALGATHNTLTDDYYYYERIARNLVAGLGSTFDGVVQTNGYHPLWLMLVILAVYLEKLTGILARNWALLMCASLAMTVLWMICLRVPRLTLSVAFIVIALAAYSIFFGVMGMETSMLLLCGGLMLFHLRDSGFRLNAVSGIFLSLCFLSRIDSLVFFFPITFYLWCASPVGRKVKTALPVMLTVGVYCLTNQRLFGVPFPISGLAKTVDFHHGIMMHRATWEWLLMGAQSQLMLVACILLTAWTITEVPSEQRRYAYLSALGVLLFYSVNSVISDWPILAWYLYPMALHLILLAVLDRTASNAPRWMTLSLPLRVLAASCALGALGMVGFRNVRHAGHQEAVMLAAERIQRIVSGQPGATIAMGDRAGAVGEIVPNRVVQLEGLVMDRDYINRLHQSKSINELLRGYKVDYYVATNPRAENDGCYTVWEPGESRGESFRLEGRICATVVASFTLDGWHTVVFRLREVAAPNI